MDGSLFLRGLGLGLAIAAPVGPIGVLVMRRTLANGRRAGFVTGMGAATADALYGLVGALGLTAITSVLVGSQFWLRLGGGLFLCYLGIATLRSVPAERAAQVARGAAWGAYFSTLLLTLANPLTILSFAAVFAGMGLGAAGGPAGITTLVGGVFAGSALWWLVLSGGVGLLRGRLTPALLRRVNLLSGAIILGFGLFALASLR